MARYERRVTRYENTGCAMLWVRWFAHPVKKWFLAGRVGIFDNIGDARHENGFLVTGQRLTPRICLVSGQNRGQE